MNIIIDTSPSFREGGISAAPKSKDAGAQGNLFSIIGTTMGLFLLSQIITCIGMSVYIVSNIMKTTDVTKDFSFEITFGDGMIDKNLILIMLYSEIFMILLFIFYARFKAKLSMSEIGFVRKDMFKYYLAGIIGATITMFAAAMICIAFGAFTIERAEFSFGYMLLFTFGWIIQGLAEEVMCRGFMMTAIAKRYSVPVAIITNSIVFALLHILNPSGMTILAMVNLFMYGVLASLMYLYTQNIWLCAAYHTTWNMIQGNVLNIPVSGVKVPSVFETTFNDKLAAINGGAFGMEGGIAVTIVVIIGCALLLMMIKRKKQT